MARVASADGRAGGGAGCPPVGAVPRNSPSHDWISRSSRGAGGGGGRWVRWLSPAGGWLTRAVALFTAFRTAFLAIDSRVVCGSSEDAACVRAVGIRVVPAPDGALERGWAGIRVVAARREAPSAAGWVGSLGGLGRGAGPPAPTDAS